MVFCMVICITTLCGQNSTHHSVVTNQHRLWGSERGPGQDRFASSDHILGREEERTEQ